jgi:nucleotide-binding universal stress UspA family protein
MYKKILLPIDLHEDSSWQKALPAALEYCRVFDPSLHILSVVPSLAMGVTAYLPKDAGHKLVENAEAVLAAFVDEHVPDSVDVQHLVAQGTVYQVILETAEKIGADLIIMSAHRPALSSYLLGPNSARVVRHAKCSALILRD